MNIDASPDQYLELVYRSGRLSRLGWTGDWPPPETIGIAVGKTTGYVSHFVPAEVPEGDIAAVHQVADVTLFRRVSCSELPDDVVTGSLHLARGARYEAVL